MIDVWSPISQILELSSSPAENYEYPLHLVYLTPKPCQIFNPTLIQGWVNGWGSTCHTPKPFVWEIVLCALVKVTTIYIHNTLDRYKVQHEADGYTIRRLGSQADRYQP